MTYIRLLLCIMIRAGFFGKGFSLRVNHVDEPCVGQILDVVHNRGPRRVDVFRQLADVGSHRTVYREQI